ncbi:MAG: hypothetical protein ACXABY_32780 [Candidatus Thorarchaeota archaeon]|jgi:hypothetical protein
MAVSTTDSVNITLREATPQTKLEAASAGGKMRVWMDTVALVTADTSDDGDVWYMAEVPSNAKIVSIGVMNDEIDAHATPTLDVNLGLYNGGTPFTLGGTSYAAKGLISESAYASAWVATATTNLGVATIVPEELAFEARNINAINNFVWEDAGLASDPHVPFYICFTVATAAATHADGDVTIIVKYTVE